MYGRLGIRRDAVETIECGVGNTEVDREIPAFVYLNISAMCCVVGKVHSGTRKVVYDR